MRGWPESVNQTAPDRELAASTEDDEQRAEIRQRPVLGRGDTRCPQQLRWGVERTFYPLATNTHSDKNGEANRRVPLAGVLPRAGLYAVIRAHRTHACAKTSHRNLC